MSLLAEGMERMYDDLECVGPKERSGTTSGFQSVLELAGIVVSHIKAIEREELIPVCGLAGGRHGGAGLSLSLPLSFSLIYICISIHIYKTTYIYIYLPI
jgi:hypothetical protein